MSKYPLSIRGGVDHVKLPDGRHQLIMFGTRMDFLVVFDSCSACGRPGLCEIEYMRHEWRAEDGGVESVSEPLCIDCANWWGELKWRRSEEAEDE